MDRNVIERVARIKTSDVSGTFFRHAAPGRDPLAGGSGGRWGARFPVIYLGRPTDSVVIEAYRHLVEEPGVPPEFVKARVLYETAVVASNILDLTDPEAVREVGLTSDDLATKVGDYQRCQDVAAAAHQLQLHGILAPAAHGLGATLALFRNRISANEMPTVVSETLWTTLPVDPRLPRAEDDDDLGGTLSV